MHHPFAAAIWLIVMAFLVAVMLTKRPHKTWMKTAMAAFYPRVEDNKRLAGVVG
jgi:hypothetical protein